MGHRHLFGTPQMFENDHDQSWNMHAEHPYGHIARGNVGENGAFFYPVENVSSEGLQFTSHWNSAPRSNGYIPIGQNDQLQPCQPDAPGPSQDPFIPRSNVATFGPVPENYFPHASSSNYDRQTPYAVEGGGFTDIAMDSGRAHQKRKSPGIPAVCERGNTSRYYSGGTSSDVPAFSEYRQDMSSVDAQHLPWDHIAAGNPGYRSNSHSVRSECSLRNVRSRSGIDLESNSLRSHLPDNPPLNSFAASHPIEHSSLVDIPGPSSNALTTEWSHANLSPAHGRILLPDPRGFSHESNHFSGGSNPSNAPPDARGYDFMTSRNPVVPQFYHVSSSQSLRGPRNSYSHRSTPAFRPSNSMRLGNASLSEERIQSIADNYSRHSRTLSATGWRHSDRNRRSRITNERYRSFPDEAGVHDRVGYEELLALGERIGTVSTGLSEDSISECLKETVHCSLFQMRDEENCVICLEAYREGDNIGTLKTCTHHYHVSCIKKWLLMKNSCPICKASALADDMKEK
ncbi:hypothetical protein CDL15_Pgr025580 [Punica granatum]|uniref:RING-type E3 ubiquitin transferase n=1 Tax=Punica granatum TaxID=22663 RepID=A0A218WC07_PUNGR|nr:hypothetical protein CDL15_Pgr025580 [Punica granatum]